MPNKDRLLVLLRTLQEQSDDETSLTTADIRRALRTKTWSAPSARSGGT